MYLRLFCRLTLRCVDGGGGDEEMGGDLFGLS
jgi:hypothetical protein